jgi:hypothetical protein
MIKSITIKDKDGELLLKISCSKNGEYEQIIRSDLHHWKISARNEKNQKIYLPE